jgi:acetyl-CoA carboxylase biotin carboxyl carrier protein
MTPKIDYKEITKILDLLDERNLSEFELEIEGFKIKASRNRPPAAVSGNFIPVSPVHPQEQPASKEEEEAPSDKINDDYHYIRSPMVGTFYRAPDPSASPFVEVGDPVKPNQTLSIIEAMKLMNEIESDTEGIIEKILVENGSPVEYGQKLFAIKTN